ncbi:MAG: diphthine synthase [Candidatus Thermoplasmatota archaeon]|nr:diphthine synthase [Candidatus Thermoplasmatota archaeon]
MGELVFVGVGLQSDRDLTLAGLEAARNCDHIFAEFYTSRPGVSVETLEETIGKPIEVLSREHVEQEDVILTAAAQGRVCLLTGGDPLTATTHIDLRLRAVERGIPTRVIHGVSIVTAAAGLLGLQIYKFGRTTTLAYPEKNYFPLSPYHVIRENRERGLHTLVLLDIQDERQRYMTIPEGVELLLEMEQRCDNGVIPPGTVLAGVARASSSEPVVKAGYPGQLQETDFGPPLHSLVVPGSLHMMEARALVELADGPPELLDDGQERKHL